VGAMAGEVCTGECPAIDTAGGIPGGMCDCMGCGGATIGWGTIGWDAIGWGGIGCGGICKGDPIGCGAGMGGII